MYLVYVLGGRGGDLEKWPDGTHATAGDVYNADPSSDIEHLDELKFCGLDLIDQQLRVRVLFRASKTGEYRFGVKAKYYAKLYLDGVSITYLCKTGPSF